VIQGYAAAIEARDLAALRALWPSLKGQQEDKIRSAFAFTKSHRVQIEPTSIEIEEGSAVVSGQRKDSVVTREGQMFRSDRATVIRLVKNSERWSIAAIQ
jgi:hypothetical protein